MPDSGGRLPPVSRRSDRDMREPSDQPRKVCARLWAFLWLLLAPSLLLAQSIPPLSQPLVQQLDRAVSEATAARSVPYRLQPGDELEIRAFAIPDLSATVRVRPDGRISLVLLDEIEVAGRTPTEVSDLLSSLYSKSYRNPKVTVVVRNFSSYQVYVGGAVEKPGLISLSAGLTATAAIFEAGGFSIREGPKHVILLRQAADGNRTTTRFDLDDVLLRGQTDVSLQSGDILYVPKHGISVYVAGEVVEPGLVELTGRLTALTAIMKARGLKSSARSNNIILLRDSGKGNPVISRLNVKEMLSTGAGDMELQPFDVVYVPKSTIAKIDQFVDQYMRQLLPISVNFGFSYVVGGGAAFIE